MSVAHRRDDEFSKEQLAEVEQMGAEGKTRKAVLQRFGITDSAYRRIPGVMAAYKRGAAKFLAEGGANSPVPSKGRPGRPPVVFNQETLANIEGMAGIGCTVEEIAMVVGCNESTIEKHPEVMATIREGRSKGKMSLRRMQMQAARNGNTTMMIWLGKQMLGQKDKADDGAAGMTPDELRKAIREDVAGMAGTVPGPPEDDE